MPGDDEPSMNPFVRFKQHVDAHVGAGVSGVLGISSSFSGSSNSRQMNNSQEDSKLVAANSNRHSAYNHSDDASPDFRAWIHEQREAAASEDRVDDYFESLDSWFGGHGSNEMLTRRWFLFMHNSRYSPIRLTILPRQPRPRDVEDDMDPNMFTYVDAFEDLLAESAGRQTMDLRTRYEMNKLLHQMYPKGEHPESWFRRLDSQDLTKTYFRYSRFPQLQKQKRVTGEWDETSREEDRDKLTRTARQESNIRDSEHSPHSYEEEPSTGQTTFFGELDRVFKALNKVLEDEVPSCSKTRPKKQSDSKDDGQDREPRTENDLYNAVSSAFAEAERSLSTFLKSFSEGRWGIDRQTRTSEMNKPTNTAEPAHVSEAQDGEPGQTLRSKREWVDEYGNLHVRTEIRRTSADGTEVERETHYSVRPASEAKKPEWEQSYDEGTWDEQVPSSVDDAKRNGGKKSGWFWR